MTLIVIDPATETMYADRARTVFDQVIYGDKINRYNHPELGEVVYASAGISNYASNTIQSFFGGRWHNENIKDTATNIFLTRSGVWKIVSSDPFVRPYARDAREIMFFGSGADYASGVLATLRRVGATDQKTTQEIMEMLFPIVANVSTAVSATFNSMTLGLSAPWHKQRRDLWSNGTVEFDKIPTVIQPGEIAT